jgi:hypothetical protein
MGGDSLRSPVIIYEEQHDSDITRVSSITVQEVKTIDG